MSSVCYFSNVAFRDIRCVEYADLASCPVIKQFPIRPNTAGVSVVARRFLQSKVLFMFRLYKDVHPYYELADVWLNPALRGKRLQGPNSMKWSTLLMSVMLRTALKHKVQVLTLWTLRSNVAATRLYQRWGFKYVQMHKKTKQRIEAQNQWIGQKDELVGMMATFSVK